jgi:hypothetical protein
LPKKVTKVKYKNDELRHKANDTPGGGDGGGGFLGDIGMPAVSKTGSPRKEEFKCDYCEMLFGPEEVCVNIRICLKRGAKWEGKSDGREGGREGAREGGRERGRRQGGRE